MNVCVRIGGGGIIAGDMHEYFALNRSFILRPSTKVLSCSISFSHLTSADRAQVFVGPADNDDEVNKKPTLSTVCEEEEEGRLMKLANEISTPVSRAIKVTCFCFHSPLVNKSRRFVQRSHSFLFGAPTWSFKTNISY